MLFLGKAWSNRKASRGIPLRHLGFEYLFSRPLPMRNAKEGKQKHGEQKHIERLPLFSATDTNGSMTMPLLPGRPVGRSAPLMQWRGCTVGALWVLTGPVTFERYAPYGAD
ncbi:hypothetical protein B2I21_16770 [Chryseobacterium mucoviscidosis]|nr:hypothetical protein B2I21_16770 [Chryseobacterium mucoviscidosis]